MSEVHEHHGDGQNFYIGRAEDTSGVVTINPAEYAVPGAAFIGNWGTGYGLGTLAGGIRLAVDIQRPLLHVCSPADLYEIGEDDHTRLKEPLAAALAEAVRAGVSVKIERAERTDGAPDTVRVEIGGTG